MRSAYNPEEIRRNTPWSSKVEYFACYLDMSKAFYRVHYSTLVDNVSTAIAQADGLQKITSNKWIVILNVLFSMEV